MKNIYNILILLMFFSLSSEAQVVPPGMKYQAVARDLNGQVIANQNISLEVALVTYEKSDNYKYVEHHKVTTNNLGLFTLTIGNGEIISGAFEEVPWGTDQIWIELSIDSKGGNDFVFIHSSKLLAVPYAFHAGTASEIAGEGDTKGASKAWTVDGNLGTNPDNHFIGTVDPKDIVFKTAWEERMRITGDDGTVMMYLANIDHAQILDLSAGDLEVVNDVGIGGELHVVGWANFQDNIQIEQNLDVLKSGHIGEDFDINGDLEVGGDLDIGNDLFIANDLEVNGISTLNELIVENEVLLNSDGGSTVIEGPTEIHNTLDVDGSTHLNITGGTTTIDGVTTITNLTNSTAPTNGALNVDGGVGIERDMNVAGNTHINFNNPGNTTTIDGVTTITHPLNSTAPTNGALNVDGGVGVEKDMNVTGNVHINFDTPGNTTTIDGVTTVTHPLNSTAPTNGALNVDGGVGVEKDMNVTGNVHINFDTPGNTTTIDGVTTITHPLNSTAPTNGALNVDGGVGVEKDMNVTGNVHINFDTPGNTTTIDGVTTITHPLNSTAPTNGALNVDGGVGVEKDMNVTGNVHINFDTPGNTTTIDGVTTITHPLNSTAPTNGALNVDGGVGIEKDVNIAGHTKIDKTLRVITDDSSTGVAGGYVAHFENQSNGQGICIQVGAGAPTHSNNFITFKNSGGGTVGRIEGETIADLPNNDDYQQELDFYDIDIAMADKEIDMEENERTMAIADASIAAGELAIAIVEAAIVATDIASAAGSGSQPVVCPPCTTTTGPNAAWVGVAAGNASSAAGNVTTAGLNQGLADANVVLAGDNVALAEENKADNEFKKQAFINLYQMQIGVTYESGAGDYAEYLPKLNPEDNYKPGEVVGLKGGTISKNTLGADRVMVISLKPAVLGALPKEGTEGSFEKVAFLGQLLTKTMGKVSKGDYMLPSGFHNGCAIAKHPSDMLISDYKKILGVAWGDSESNGLSYVNVAVGLNTNDMSNVIQQQQAELEALKNQIAQTNNILADLVPGFKEAASMTASTEYVASVNTQTQLDIDKEVPGLINGKYILPTRSDCKAGIDKARQLAIDRGEDVANHPFWNRLDTDPDYQEEVIYDMEKQYAEALAAQLEQDKQK